MAKVSAFRTREHTYMGSFLHVSVEMDVRKLCPSLRPVCTIYTESAAALESCRKERGIPPHVGKQRFFSIFSNTTFNNFQKRHYCSCKQEKNKLCSTKHSPYFFLGTPLLPPFYLLHLPMCGSHTLRHEEPSIFSPGSEQRAPDFPT